LEALEIAVGQYLSPLKNGKYSMAQYNAIQGPYFYADIVIKALTGNTTTRIRTTGWNTEPAIETAIKDAISKKKVICALTWVTNPNRTGIVSGHWYAVIGYKNGEVQLRNPWGFNNNKYDGGKVRGDGKATFWMPIKEFRQIFHSIDYEN
jgi:hypothetical protein